VSTSNWKWSVIGAGLSTVLCSCGGSSTDSYTSPTQVVRETSTGTISADTSPTCSRTFQLSVDASYYQGGLQRCVEFPYMSTMAGLVSGRLTWQNSRIDLDLVLNDSLGTNYRQSIAANRSGEAVDFFVNAGTRYIFIIYLRGVDPVFLANGGQFTGAVSTMFTLAVERPR
jgi:hypothetical protein